MEDIKTKAIRSVKWTALSEIVSRSIQPIVMLVLARLLTPADFGVVGVAIIAVGLAQIFQDFGLGKTLIQTETDIEESANIVFWSNLVLSIFMYLTLFVSAPLISDFFHDSKVTNVLRVLCLQIILISLSTVHQALFQRDFQYKNLFFVRLFSAVIPAFVSIPLALSGYGVWSLVLGTLAGSIAQVFTFLGISKWRPRLDYNFELARKLFGFSSWVVLEAFLGWIILWGDSIALGHFLGVKELGVYRIGIALLMAIFGIFFNPILPVAYSAFSRLQANREELKQSFLKITTII
ncbi:MAG TPA: lipopolysaccharide biosynthesis protein, partial [Thermodesulfovibrionales bacterium]|nr:lipopolysaccharide biosynthesis protein [Thermodesulfovibrionales bacterium]